MEVWDAVVSVSYAFDRCLIDAVLNKHRSKRRPGNQRLPNDDVAPCGRYAVRPDSDLDAMRVHGAIVAAAHIILASPNELDRRAAQPFGDHRRFALHVRIDHSAATKTTPGKFGVESDLFRF